MTERRMTVSQARHLLRVLTERNQGHLVPLAEDILNATGDALMAPANSVLTYRGLEYFRERSDEDDPRIRLLLFEDTDEIRDYSGTPEEEAESELTARTLQQRATQAARDVASKADDVATAALSIQSVGVGLHMKPADRSRSDVKAMLKEMERALRQLRASTQIAVDEYLGNQNPLVLDLIKGYQLDLDAARHGLRVACFATELAAHLTAEGYFGKAAPDDLYERARVDAENRIYTPEALEALRERLFRTELVEIFMGGFLHDAGLWSSSVYDGHEERGAMVVSEIPELNEIADALLDIVFLHDDIDQLSTSGGVIWTRAESDEKVTFEKDYYPSEGAAEEFMLLRTEATARLVGEESLHRVLPVAIAEFFLSATEGRGAKTPREAIAEAVAMGDSALYAKFMMTLCNSQPQVEAPPRTLVAFDGKIAAGATGRKHLMELDGDLGVSVHNAGWSAPHVIRILRKGADGGLQKLKPIQPGDPVMTERSDPLAYMYVPVGRMGNLTVTVVGVLGKEAYERAFTAYAQWIEGMD